MYKPCRFLPFFVLLFSIPSLYTASLKLPQGKGGVESELKRLIQEIKDDRPLAAKLLATLQKDPKKRRPSFGRALQFCAGYYKPELKQLAAQEEEEKQVEDDDPFAHAHQCFEQSDYDRAIVAYQRVFQAGHDNPKARIGYGESLLAQGNYKDGFKNREARLKNPGYALKKPWDGHQPIHEKVFLIRREGGIGDTATFTLRYLALLRSLGARIICEGNYPERSILKQFMANNNRIIGKIAEPGSVGDDEFDYDIYSMSLPHYFSANLEVIPTKMYLSANFSNVSKWIKEFEKSKEGTLHMPFCWRASKNPGGIWRMYKRDIPLPLIAQLSKIPGVKLYPLHGPDHKPITQKEYDQRKAAGTLKEGSLDLDELDILPDDCTVERVAGFDEGGPFTDTLAMMQALQERKDLGLVVSVDTSNLCLAGAVGAPTIGLLPAHADWRWGKNGNEKSPWFSSIDLLWQEKQGDWQSVMEKLKVIIDKKRKQ